MSRRVLPIFRNALFLAAILVAMPQTVSADGDPFDGVWQLNLAKSKNPGPAPKAQTLYMRGEGQNRTDTSVSINADGSPRAVAATHIYDGNARRADGLPLYDASAYTRVDARTIRARYTKAGKEIQTATWTVSPDSKTLTITVGGVDASGRKVDDDRVYDKQ